MATFLDTPTSGVHPSVVSYLASGSPIRQSFVGSLASRAPYIPPSGVMPNPATNYHQAMIDQGFGGGEVPHVAPGSSMPMSALGFGATPPAGGGGAAGMPDIGKLDYQADPILQKVLAAMKAGLTTARGNALSQYKDLLLGFGSQELAKTTLSKLLGQAGYSDLPGGKKIDKFLASVSDNPDTSQSTMAQLARALREATRTTNEGMSSSQGGNLFFSGAHARSLRDLDYQHQAQTANATQALRQALFGASQGELATEQSWSQQILAAEEAAYSRALQVALANAAMASGGYGSGGSGDGGGSGGDGGSTPGQVTPANAPANAPGQISQGVPWQVALPLSLLNPNDIRVRRLQ